MTLGVLCVGVDVCVSVFRYVFACVGVFPAGKNNYSTNSGAPEYVQPEFLMI